MSIPVVWVTGASRGIGRAVACRFATEGAAIALSSRSEGDLRALQNEIAAAGTRVIAVPCDMRKPDDVQSAHAAIAAALGPVDVLVNNAGISAFKPFIETSGREFDEILATNFTGPVAAAHAVLPSMTAKKQGHIFNLISITARKLFTNSAAYAASKAALAAAMDVLREELRGTGVRIINVIPGATDTAIWPEKVRRKYADRMMKPETVAEAIVMVYRQPPEATVEEIVLRPVTGDL